MRKALISPNEIVTAYDGSTGYRVAEVSDQTFEVALPLYWEDCPDDCVADQWYVSDGVLMPIPQPPVDPE